MNLRQIAWIRGSACSTGTRVFYSREGEFEQGAAHRRPTHGTPGAAMELPLDLPVGEVRLLLDDGANDEVLLRHDAGRIASTELFRLEAALLAAEPLPPTDLRDEEIAQA